MGHATRRRQWRNGRNAVPGGGGREIAVHRAWRWLFAMPWLVVVAAVALRGIQGGLVRLDLGLGLVLLIAAGMAAGIVAAPPGGWLVFVGLAASAAGLVVLLVALAVASYSAWEASTYGTADPVDYTGFIAAGLVYLASGLGVVLLGIWDMTHRQPRSDRPAAG